MRAPLAVPTKTIRSGQLLHHVSWGIHRGKALYFGAHLNRFDDPTGRFGVLYLGFDLATALMESVFHNHHWHRSRRSITRVEFDSRMVRMVGVAEDLTLADLSAPGVMAADFGLNLSQLVSRRYRHTQRVSTHLHRSTAVDGLLYPSRNNFPAGCIALFDRASMKVGVAGDIDLACHVDWPAFSARYRVAVLP